ncbi:MAG: phosphate/phosphite/phosphonate ABC transporter substrate-binding protein [Chloroflexota bacterium]
MEHMRLQVTILLLITLIIGLGASACSATSATQAQFQVDLDDLQPLPDRQRSEVLPLRVAIAAIISPEGTVESYDPLLKYLVERLDRPVEVEQRRTYAEVNELVRTGEVDLAFVCTSAYIAGRQDFDMQLLVAPIVQGETFYRSQLIVPTNSAAVSIDDLRGKVFAFTDPMSFTGRVYPTYLLQQMETTPAEFFLRTFFTYSHDDAIMAVANSLADGAAVDSLVLDFALARDPELGAKLHIIHTSPPFGVPPVVVGPDIRPQLRVELESVFLSMHESPEGLRALQALDIERFTLVAPELYDAVEDITASVACEGDQP